MTSNSTPINDPPSTPSTKNPSMQDDKQLKDAEDYFAITSEAKTILYYHGLLPRADIEPLLKDDGDFLLRKTENNGVIILALSVRWKNQVKHFMINQNESKEFYLESHTEKSITELINYHSKTQAPCSTASGAKLIKPIDKPSWIITHDSVKIIKKLGEGAFGEVFMADFTTDNGVIQVAAKTMREEIGREARLKFMKEARLMRKLNHKHIVKIIGVAVHEHPIMLVIELCLGGSLLSHLKKTKVTPSDKLRFCVESASGLAYLEKQNFIHRDIAARNCLLSDKMEVKISDFGMSDDRKQLTDDKLEKVPVKWLSPETLLTKTFSIKSDVWSYGILVFEIFADGAKPYPGLTNAQARAKIVSSENYRMDMPKDTPSKVSKIIYQCWNKEPTDRPSFKTIYEKLKAFAEKEEEKEKEKEKKDEKKDEKKEAAKK